jgi:hypothetical protein
MSSKTTLKFKLRAVSLVLIILPMLIVSVSGLTSVLSFSKDYAEQSSLESANAQIEKITDIISKYTTYLSNAAELPFIRSTASGCPDSRIESNGFFSSFADNEPGVYDILITNASGLIFSSYTGNYTPATAFRDDLDTLNRIAASPNSVSGFYDGGRFYCARPIRDIENVIVGYIILKTEPDLIENLLYIEDTEITLIISDDPNVDFTDEISGTRWRWTYTSPLGAAMRSTAYGVFFRAFAIGAGISLVNIIIMFIITKKMNFKTGDK